MADRYPSIKMLRFLKSIGISEPNDFDLDFVSITHDATEYERVVMRIAKGTPWEYRSLALFEEGLASIKYLYRIEFAYDEEPQDEEVERLLLDWYLDHCPSYPPCLVVPFEGDVLAVYPSKGMEEKELAQALKPFSQLLSEIGYKYKIEIAPKEEKDEAAPKDETPAEKPFEGKPAEASLSEKEEEPEEEDASTESDDDMDEEAPLHPNEETAHREELRMTEEAELERLASIGREAERRRIYNKGNYAEAPSFQELYALSGNVSISGEIVAPNVKTGRNGKLFANFVLGKIGDGAIKVRVSSHKGEFTDEFVNGLADGNGKWVLVRGALERDDRTNQLGIFAHYIDYIDPPPLRTDNAPEKRVELHLHTKMSAMDGLGDVEDYMKTAVAMGMKAMAITDHGNLQSFPLAENALLKMRKSDPNLDFRIIYGVEFYAFKKLKFVYNPRPIALKNARYCVFDFETTGLSNRLDRVTEFGGVIVQNGFVSRSDDFFVDAGLPIPEKIQRKTRITNEMIRGQLSEREAAERIERFIGGDDVILVSHNARFDVGFLNAMRERVGLPPLTNPVIDTLALSFYLFPEAGRHNLGALSRNLKLDVYNNDEAHRADFDAQALNSVWQAILPSLTTKLGKSDLTHEDLAHLEISNRNFYKHLKTFHVTALARNQEGLKALYRLVSKSETVYMASGSVPKIDIDDLEAERANLLLGSACYNGEVFMASSLYSLQDLHKAISFYDYVELQPLENYSYLVDTEEWTEEQLMDILRTIVKVAREERKRLVATGDCHYVNPEDKILRDLYINATALGGGLHPLRYLRREQLHNPDFASPDQHFRSTEEMLKSFERWMPEEEAYELVVTASNEIADMCGDIKVLKDRLYTPDANLPGSAEKLRGICYENLEKTYGQNPPAEVKERLDQELDGIINNGYSVTYYIAHLLIKWANSKDFFVGSRGSVGSSFAAHMAGITEVNPLRPHYLCPKCKHFEWADDPSLRSGFDLPAKACPECGAKMKGNGQSIPFQTFLGFHAEKVPDIDLNFPQDRLGLAHDETRRLLSTPEENAAYEKGEAVSSPHVIRAGTIAKAESKNCFKYVKDYYEGRLHKAVGPDDQAYISFLSEKATGVKRTTGQHPGGIVVIPADMEIFDFTPYQYPADDPEAGWLTTHFDFNSMHDSVLKLDELGHIDPMALRIMHEMTGVDFRDLPMNDPKVLSLFTSPKALKLQRNPLGFKTGAIALPEFGTGFVQGLLEEAKPHTFNDLLIISGLSHGTNVWQSNAEDLIKAGKSLDQVIGCRDDIMNYLIQMGLDSGTAFKIMEFVRKNKAGKPLKSEFEEAMRAAKVPEWYIDSCRKIRYLFPRAHATAYVMAALRVAWYKVYRPLEFYATYFYTRCDSFDISIMSSDIGRILQEITYLQAKINRKEANKTDEEKLKAFIVTVELLERGYAVENVSLEKSDAVMWGVDRAKNAVVPPFTCIPNFPQRTAEGIVKAREGGPFLSKEDLTDRVKKVPDGAGGYYSLGGAALKQLEDIGALEGLEESQQMSLFQI